MSSHVSGWRVVRVDEKSGMTSEALPGIGVHGHTQTQHPILEIDPIPAGRLHTLSGRQHEDALASARLPSYHIDDLADGIDDDLRLVLWNDMATILGNHDATV
jgi:hypothetical protein